MPIEQHPFVSNRWLNNLNIPLTQDQWFLNRNNENQIKSFGFMPNKNVKSIFLGSFPIWEIVTRQIDQQYIEFFYGSHVNDFWNCLSSILIMPVNTFNERIEILNKTEIGLTDILERVDRNPANSNADKCLTAINYNSILDLKEHYPFLKNIFITSGGRGAVGNLNNNNKNSATWLKQSLINHKLEGFNQKGFVKQISIDNRKFNLIYLYSPSGEASRPIQGVLNNYNNFGIQDLNILHFRKIQWCYFIKTYHLGDFTNPIIDEIINLIQGNEELSQFFNN